MLENEDEIRRFLLAGKRGTVSSVCDVLGMSKATYYRTVDWIVECVVSVQERDRNHREAAERQLQSGLQERLLVVVMDHPTWGCQKLAKELSQSTRVTANAVSALLDSLNLTTRRQRTELLIRAVLERRIYQLSAEQEKAIADVNPLLNDFVHVGSGADLVVGVALVPVFGLLGKNWYLQLFVELGSLFAFGGFIQKKRDHCANSTIAHKNASDLAFLQAHCGKQGCHVYWNSRAWSSNMSEYHPIHRMEARLRVHRIHKPAAGVAMVAQRIRDEFIAPRLARGEGQSMDRLRDELVDWFIAHDFSARRDFPTMSKSPVETLGIDTKEARSYLLKVASDNVEDLPWTKLLKKVRPR